MSDRLLTLEELIDFKPSVVVAADHGHGTSKTLKAIVDVSLNSVTYELTTIYAVEVFKDIAEAVDRYNSV